MLLRRYLAARGATDPMAARSCLRSVLPDGWEPDPAPVDEDSLRTVARLAVAGEGARVLASVIASASRPGDDAEPAFRRLLDVLRDPGSMEAPPPAPPSAEEAVPRAEHEAALRALHDDLREARRQGAELRRHVLTLEADLHRERSKVAPVGRSPEDDARRERELRMLMHDAALLKVERQARAGAEARIADLEREIADLRRSLERTETAANDLREERDSLRRRVQELEQRIAAGPAKKVRPQRSEERVGIYVDVSNLYYAAMETLGGTVDYRRIRETVEAGRRVVRAVAFLVDSEENLNQGFKSAIQDQGFQLQVRRLVRRGDGSAKGNWDIGMALAIKEDVERLGLDTVVLASGDGDFVDLFQDLRPQGVRLEVLGVPGSIAHRLREAADEVVEIDRDWVYRQRPDAPRRAPVR